MNGDTNYYGLSRKTNIAIAGMASMAAAQSNLTTVFCILGLGLVGIVFQQRLDRRELKIREKQIEAQLTLN